MLKSNVTLIVLNSILFTSVISFEEAGAFKFSKETCRQYNLGSNWYCGQETKPQDLTSAEEIMQRDVTPEHKAVLLNRLHTLQKKRAVITRTDEDLNNVLKTQKYIAFLASDYALKMLRLTETRPEHSNYENYHTQIIDEFTRDQEQKRALMNGRDRFALAFIYRSICPACRHQLKAVHSLKEETGFTVLGVSTDGGIYPGLDQVVVDKNIEHDPNVISLPTLMLVDSKTNKRLFIAKGITSNTRLQRLIYEKIKEVENE